MAGIVPYAGVDIAVFELIKEQLQEHYGAELPPSYLLLGAGMLSRWVSM